MISLRIPWVAVLELRLAEHSGGGWIEKEGRRRCIEERKLLQKKRLSETIA